MPLDSDNKDNNNDNNEDNNGDNTNSDNNDSNIKDNIREKTMIIDHSGEALSYLWYHKLTDKLMGMLLGI